MMSVEIDPSEMRGPAAARAVTGGRPAAARLGRTLLLAGLGGFGLVGLSAGAYSMLSGLAGPPLGKARLARGAADWPDLKDGVPALAPASASAAAPQRAQALVSAPAAQPPAEPAVPERWADPPGEPKPALPSPLPAIETIALAPAALAPLVMAVRTAALVGPRPAEAIRARAPTVTVAALPLASREAAAPRRKALATAQTPPPVAVAQAAAPALAPDPEETEVFGLKVPSLAPAGRRFVEGVEALGKVVKEQF